MWHIAVQQKERKQLFLLNYFTPGIPKEPKPGGWSRMGTVMVIQERVAKPVGGMSP